ncbi:MAG: single-stranded DNA-binding protein [Anaerolineae bacterium]|nr:single-stranded DNA-binding protein [Anaerolineae bacterium]
MYQSLTIVGNLGGDPESRTAPNGQPVTNFSVAVNRKWKDAAGQPQEETMWMKVAAWGKLGENCAQYLAKGRQVLVVGRLTIDKKTGGPRLWQDNDGVWRASFEIRAYEVKFLGSSGSNGSADSAAEAAPAPEGEIPF